jgi:ribosomal protein S18 acetylase RimI-like enzyme
MTIPQDAASTGGDLIIAPATEADLPVVFALLDEALGWLVSRGITGQWGTTPFSEMPTMKARFMEWIAEGAFFIARVDGVAAGTLALSERIPGYALHALPAFPEPAFYLEAFTTSRTLAGRGIGRELLRWAEDYAAAKGKRAIWLDCWADNPELLAYYVRAGYEKQRDFMVGNWRGMLFCRGVIRDT